MPDILRHWPDGCRRWCAWRSLWRNIADRDHRRCRYAPEHGTGRKCTYGMKVSLAVKFMPTKYRQRARLMTQSPCTRVGTMWGAAPKELGGFMRCRAALSGILFFLISGEISTPLHLLQSPCFSRPRERNSLFRFAPQRVTLAQEQPQPQPQQQPQREDAS